MDNQAIMRKVRATPLVKSAEPLPAEMRVDMVEVCQAMVDKFLGKHEQCARGIKESLDKKYGPSWHVVVGEGFGYKITHQAKHMLYLYYQSVGVCCFKC